MWSREQPRAAAPELQPQSRVFRSHDGLSQGGRLFFCQTLVGSQNLFRVWKGFAQATQSWQPQAPLSIAGSKIPGKFRMGLGIPPLEIKHLLKSKPPQVQILSLWIDRISILRHRPRPDRRGPEGDGGDHLPCTCRCCQALRASNHKDF